MELEVKTILENVNELLENYKVPYKIKSVYLKLSIYDWWDDFLNKTQLEQMQSFLKDAIKLGFTGYACIKVGYDGNCSSGWAFKEKSLYGDCLYRSFYPDYYQIKLNGEWFPAEGGNFFSIKTMEQMEKYLKDLKELDNGNN